MTAESEAGGSAGSGKTLLRGGHLASGQVSDLLIRDGKIAAIGLAATRATASTVLDLSGLLVLPSFVEPHAHLDKALTASAVPNRDGSLAGAIEAWLAVRRGFPGTDIAGRAFDAATRYLRHGTTLIRTHVDTGADTDTGLRALAALLEVRERLAEVMEIEIVALCSVPVTGRAGATNRSLLRDALAQGADLAGGAPSLDDDPVAAIETIAALAAEAGKGMDLHLDETTDPGVFALGDLADIVAGFPHRVTASHAVSLAFQPAGRRQEVARALAAAGIGVVTLPQTNLYLQGRDLGPAAPRGLTALRDLLSAGVRVAAGGDNLQDPFNPVGRADPLETASLLAVTA